MKTEHTYAATICAAHACNEICNCGMKFHIWTLFMVPSGIHSLPWGKLLAKLTELRLWPIVLDKEWVHSFPITDSLEWHHNERDGVSNHRRCDYLLNRLFRRSSKKTSKLRVTGLCEGNSPVTGKFPAQRASNAENGSIILRHEEMGWACVAQVTSGVFFLIKYLFKYLSNGGLITDESTKRRRMRCDV